MLPLYLTVGTLKDSSQYMPMLVKSVSDEFDSV